MKKLFGIAIFCLITQCAYGMQKQLSDLAASFKCLDQTEISSDLLKKKPCQIVCHIPSGKETSWEDKSYTSYSYPNNLIKDVSTFIKTYKNPVIMAYGSQISLYLQTKHFEAYDIIPIIQTFLAAIEQKRKDHYIHIFLDQDGLFSQKMFTAHLIHLPHTYTYENAYISPWTYIHPGSSTYPGEYTYIYMLSTKDKTYGLPYDRINKDSSHIGQLMDLKPRYPNDLSLENKQKLFQYREQLNNKAEAIRKTLDRIHFNIQNKNDQDGEEDKILFITKQKFLFVDKDPTTQSECR